jgi:hypothetical protein
VPEYDLDDLWTIWLDGWRRCLLAVRAGRVSLYSDRPAECDHYGGPCIGRDGCRRDRTDGSSGMNAMGDDE